MSSYHSSFSYLGKNSMELQTGENTSIKLIISHFSNNADSGESESGLSTESIYTASPDGTSRNLYGTKYSGAEPVRITVIKQDGSDFTIGDNRFILKWLTGAKSDSWLDLYIGDEVRYRLLGHVQNVLQYKMDARIVGLIIVFESASPFAFSTLQTCADIKEKDENGETVSKYPSGYVPVNGSETFSIMNPSDDNYTFVKMQTTYKHTAATQGPVTIKNTYNVNGQPVVETTEINNLVVNEVVTMSNNQSITSDKSTRIFGNDFNFVFPRLAPGKNTFTVTGTGELQFEYSYFIKIGDMATELNAVSDRICDDFGNIQIDVLDWSRIINTPTTVDGYGITDAVTNGEFYRYKQTVYTKDDIDTELANFYTKSQMDTILENFNSDDVYTKKEIDDMLENFTQADVYTKAEIDAMFDGFSPDDMYTKTEIDQMFADIDYNISTYTKEEIDEKINNITVGGVDISEYQLNAMLMEVLV